MFRNAKVYLGFNDIPLLIAGIPAVSMLMPFLFFQGNIETFEAYCAGFGAGCIFTSIFWLVNRQVMIFYRKRYQTPQEDRKRVIMQLITIVIVTVGLSFFLNGVKSSIFEDYEFAKYPRMHMTAVSLFITLAVVVLYDAVYYVSRWKQTSLEAEQLKKETLESQLASLEAQINPHFLFNSLNTLASLVPEDPEKAVEFVHKLSAVYRCILEHRGRPVVSLDEELECLNNYVFLLKTRFGKNIQIEENITDQSRSRFIVPLGLQMLVENAVKHNVVSSKRPLKIGINATQDNIVVVNNLQPKLQVEDSTKTGLENIQKRYLILGNREVKVFEDRQKFQVTIPLLEVEDYEDSDH